MPQVISEHYRQSFHNEGVNASLEDIKNRSLGALINTWADKLAAMPETRSVVFEGVRREGNSPTGYFRYGGLDNFKLEGASDHRWKDKWPKSTRHRVVDFTIDCDIQASEYKDADPGLENMQNDVDQAFLDTMAASVN
ncbi:hypothetical protein BG003_000419 [Podila horticola]|nr:hypothetical protein BG003_000419 [Podila horticola]